MNASISITVPNSMPKNPAASTMCGGLMMRTSSPYALCHQSSNGAEVEHGHTAHAQTNAPSGPESPQMRTLTSFIGDAPLNVVVRIR